MTTLYDAIAWVPASGATIALDDWTRTGLKVGRVGFFAPAYSFLSNTVPEQPGQQLQRVVVGVREVDLPLLIQGTSITDLRTRLRAVVRAFDPTRGDGILRVTTVDGMGRDLTCRYVSGLEIAETADLSGPTWLEATVVLRAFDPYWYANTPIVSTYTQGSSVLFFPILPLRIGNTSNFGNPTVTNPGDVSAWPIWTVTGPGSNVLIQNVTTGETLSSYLTLIAGQVLTIDTRPGIKSVTREDGSNQFATLSSTSTLWEIGTGNVAINLTMTGASGASSVVLSYTPRYLGI